MGPEIKGNEYTKQSGTVKVKKDLYMPLAVVKQNILTAKAQRRKERKVYCTKSSPPLLRRGGTK